MISGLKEQAAVFATVTALVGLPATIYRFSPGKSDDPARIIQLTAVMSSGVWTDEVVNAFNYGWKSFRPAVITVAQGEEVLLHLRSADVTHTFYLPELHPDPIIVEPGHMMELRLANLPPGVYSYYCITVCGDCHYAMRGTLIVGKTTGAPTEGYDSSLEVCAAHDSPPPGATYLERGSYLYTSLGCVSCHGRRGEGGVYNPNYINREVPRLDVIAERMMIYWEEDAAGVVSLLESGIPLESLNNDPPIDNFSRFLAQYRSITSKIKLGSPQVQKREPDGPEPPLVMPAWGTKLTSGEIDAILAYLIDQYDWEQYDDY